MVESTSRLQRSKAPKIILARGVCGGCRKPLPPRAKGARGPTKKFHDACRPSVKAKSPKTKSEEDPVHVEVIADPRASIITTAADRVRLLALANKRAPRSELPLTIPPIAGEDMVALLTDLLEATRAELKTAESATKRGWENLALFEKELMRVWRRSKKRTGNVLKKPRRPRIQPVLST